MQIPDYMIKLRQLREEHGMTQKETAQLIGVSERVYSSMESGGRDINTKQFIILRDFYDVSADWVLGLGEYAKK